MRAIMRFILAISAVVFCLAPSWSQTNDRTCPYHPPSPPSDGPPPDLCDRIYRVVCQEDAHNDHISTGFLAQVNGQVGLITALHGVVACQDAGKLEALGHGVLVDDLVITKVDAAHDVVFLTSKQLPKTLI
jgi:hypothetical protein